jgi:hypothetical protein
MFSPTRDQARRFFVEAWRKHRQREILSGLEHLAADLVLAHPEYHALLEDPQQALARDFTAQAGQPNPFLHLSLHLAIEEQLSIDQPPGIRRIAEAFMSRTGDRHEAMHEILECLGEVVWRSQRDGAPPDAQAYLECLHRRAG